MQKSASPAAIVLMSAAVVLVSPPTAEANDTECVVALPPATYDNVVVPPGATCSLVGSTVLGNVKALEKSQLVIRNSNVRGNVHGDKADVVQVIESRVRESISIKEGGPAAATTVPTGGFFCGALGNPCEVFISGTIVEEGEVQIEKMVGSVAVQQLIVLLGPGEVQKGNIKVEDNRIPASPEFLEIRYTIAQNLQVFKNTGAGGKFVDNNSVGENLQCFDNEPPFASFNNTARSEEGQCPPLP
jgi:hypothetical protein